MSKKNFDDYLLYLRQQLDDISQYVEYLSSKGLNDHFVVKLNFLKNSIDSKFETYDAQIIQNYAEEMNDFVIILEIEAEKMNKLIIREKKLKRIYEK